MWDWVVEEEDERAIDRLSLATSGLPSSTSQQRKEPLSWLFCFAARSEWKSGSRRPRVVHRGL